jgi:hypothetical protein
MKVFSLPQRIARMTVKDGATVARYRSSRGLTAPSSRCCFPRNLRKQTWPALITSAGQPV